AVEPDDEDGSISSKPDALVLINPAFGFADDRSRLTPEQRQAAEGSLGALIVSWKVVKGGPPSILFFGTEDQFQDKARDFQPQLNAVRLHSSFGEGTSVSTALSGFLRGMSPAQRAGA